MLEYNEKRMLISSEEKIESFDQSNPFLKNIIDDSKTKDDYNYENFKIMLMVRFAPLIYVLFNLLLLFTITGQRNLIYF